MLQSLEQIALTFVLNAIDGVVRLGWRRMKPHHGCRLRRDGKQATAVEDGVTSMASRICYLLRKSRTNGSSQMLSGDHASLCDIAMKSS